MPTGIPDPIHQIEGHCSTIYNDTLYVLSPDGFQSLELKKKAQWKKEASGVKVVGPSCVTVTPNGEVGQPSLWVIGGTSEEQNYDGVQVYSFAEQKWQSITTEVPVMQGRTNHSAAYLQDSEAILVYAGSQPNAPSDLSSSTWVLSTQPPYGALAFTSDAPPANIPIVTAWDTNSAVMVGGSVLNTQVSIFSPSFGWRRLGVDLVTPLNPLARGTLVDGTDGSKVLEVYDASVSPNTVTQIVLLGAGGGTARTGQIIGNDSADAAPLRTRRRDLTLQDWPPYHRHLAPTAQRTDFSVASNPDGLTVLSGGNNNMPVAIFNQDTNAWIDADNFFNSNNQQPLKPTKPSSPLPTTSTSTSPTSTAASGESSHDRMLKVLGIILGVLFGIAVLFVIILFVLRVKKLKKREREGWIEEKDTGGQQRGPTESGVGSFLNKETGGTASNTAIAPPTNTPFRQSRNSAHNSLAIITGKFNRRSGQKGYNGHVTQHSGDSTAHLVKNKEGVLATKENMELADIENRPGLQRRMTPRQERSDRAPSAIYGATLTAQDAHPNEESARRANRNRSSGWSKYFATSAPTGANGLGHIPSAYAMKNNDGSAQAGAERDIADHSNIPSSSIGPAFEAEPRTTLDGQPVSHVNMRSPAFNDSREDLAKRGSTTTEGQKGLIVDPGQRRSESDSISSYNRSATSSARNSEYNVQSTWNPTTGGGNSFKDHLNSRPPSSGASASDVDRRVPSRGKSSNFFPGAGTSYRPQKTSPKLEMGYNAAPSSTWGLPPKPTGVRQAEQPRGSNMTIWPGEKPGHRANPSADYSKPAEQRLIASQDSGALPGVKPIISQYIAPSERGSNTTVFPSTYYPDNRAPRTQDTAARPVNNDLAWLNLGEGGGANRF